MFLALAALTGLVTALPSTHSRIPHLSARPPLSSFVPPFSTDPPCPPHYDPVPLSPLPAAITSALDAVADSLAAGIDPAGAPTCVQGAVVYRGEVIWQQGFGQKRRGVDEPPDMDTLFRIGSVTKVFPVISTFQHLDEGTLPSLDTPVSKIVPAFSMKTPFDDQKARSITFRQLASQLSGLPREAPCLMLDCNFTNDVMFRRLQDETVILPAARRPSYSNLGFAVLGHANAILASTTWEQLTQSKILNPLGMTNTGFVLTEDVAARMATGYYPDGSEAPLVDIGWVSPAGQMYSSMADLAKLATELSTFKDSLFLSATSRREILLPAFLNADQTTLFSSPWETRFQHSYLVRGKGGNIDGFSASMAMVPELELSFVGAWNGGVDSMAATAAVFDLLLPAFIESLATVQPPIPRPPNPQDYLGLYHADGDLPLQIAEVTDPDSGIKYFVLQANFLGSIPLRFHSADTFTFTIPDGLMDCMYADLTAFEGQWVRFELDGQAAHSLTIPGLVPGFRWVKDTSNTTKSSAVSH